MFTDGKTIVRQKNIIIVCFDESGVYLILVELVSLDL